MKRFIVSGALLAVMAFVIPVSAKIAVTPDVPEQAGTYDVRERPGMKLRVFVHRAKPGPVTPSLVCGLTDTDSTAKVPGAGWKLPSGWTYSLNPSSVPGTVGASNLPTIAATAYAAWSAQVPSVSVTRGDDTTVTKAARDGRNIVTWGRTSGTALAVSYIWYQNGIAQEVDTIFNSRFTWYWANSGTACSYSGVYDAQDILTHELGHTFGLNDVYTGDYVNATMYGYGSTGQVNAITLSSGDITGVQALY